MKSAFSAFAVVLFGSALVFGQQSQAASADQSQVASLGSAGAAPAAAQAAPVPRPAAATPDKHKIGPFDLSVNWRTRTEGWEWFQGNTGNSDYPFFDSLFRIGVGQTRERYDWFVEGEMVQILGLPNDAVVPAPQGQLGLGGTYYAANSNQVNNTGGFLKQAFINFKHLGPANAKLGRFEFFDGMEVKPQDPMLANLIQNRISSRLIANFGFTAVQRTFDGGQFSLNSGPNNLTIFAARPVEGVFQVDGMSELDSEIYYGSFIHAVKTDHSAGEVRVFAMGYVDDRNTILKTDNRPVPVRSADHRKVEIGTYGANYVHVLKTPRSGNFDFLVWGAWQTGSWGALEQRAESFVSEAGWQMPVKALKPWLSLGYSYGSGDGDPTDGKNGTFFQVLPTPRQYARFPFYNMMNNKDGYVTLNLKPWSKLGLRTEAHTLKLANAADFWYSGGGEFAPKTFGFTGRPSGGRQSLANVLDISADYQVNKYFSTNVYFGHAWGKSVIENIYPKNPNGSLAFLETNFHF